MSYTEREFEYVGNGSSKFWRVRVESIRLSGGTEWRVITRWGRIGTRGSETILSVHLREGDAADGADAAAHRKLAKGYVEVGVVTTGRLIPSGSPSKRARQALTDEQREKLKGLLEDLDELASE